MGYIVADTGLDVARAALSAEVSPSASPALTTADLDAALGRALVVDASGRPPSHPDYSRTYSILWAAAETARTRAIRALTADQVTSFTSEGSRFDVKQTDWLSVARVYQKRAAEEAGTPIDESLIKVVATVERTPVETLPVIGNWTPAPYPPTDDDYVTEAELNNIEDLATLVANNLI